MKLQIFTRKSLLLLMIFIQAFCINFIAKSQTTIYSTNFGTTATTNVSSIAGWSISGAQSTNLTLATSSGSSGYSSPIAASGSGNLCDGAAATPAPATITGTSVATVGGSTINTTGYSSIKIAFAMRATGSNTSSVTVAWSSDSVTWTNITLPYSQPFTSTTWTTTGASFIALPVGAANVSNLRFRFTFVRTSTSGNLRVDDFTVQGTAGGTTNYWWNGSNNTSLSAAWDVGSNWTSPTATATPNIAWTDNINNVANFANTAGGTVTINGNRTLNSAVVTNTTAAHIFSSTLGGATGYTLTGPVSVAANSVLQIPTDNALTNDATLGFAGAVSAASGASVTLRNNVATSGNSTINLVGISYSVPTTNITGAGTTLSGFVSTGLSSSIAGNIINNSTSTTFLGATTSNALTINGIVSGSAGLQFSAGNSGGAGSVTLGSAGNLSTYTGATTFNAAVGAIIKIGVTNALPTATSITMAATSGNGGILDLNGFSQTIAALTSGAGGGSITNSSATTNSIFTINQSTNTTFGLSITGTTRMAVVKNGVGSLTLTNAGNTFSNGFTITAGSIVAGAANILPPSAVTLNGGTLSSGAAAGFSQTTTGTLGVTANSTIALGTGVHTLTFGNSNAIAWTGGTVVTITGWSGTAIDGTGGANTLAGQVFIGNTSSALTTIQISQIRFSIAGNLYSAILLPTGELVPTSATKIAVTAITPSTPAPNIAFTATVQSQDANGNPAIVNAATSFLMSATFVSGTMGTFTSNSGTIPVNTNLVVINILKYSSAATINVTATQTAGMALGTATSVDFSLAFVTNTTDYFRSNITTGNWATAANWQSSPDSVNWIASSMIPNFNANSITILNGHTITIDAAVTADQIVINNGATLISAIAAASFNLNNGTGDEITIQNGGMIKYTIASGTPTLASGATVRNQTGGTISVEQGGMTANNAGVNAAGYIYENASILQWNYALGAPSSSGVTFFPAVAANIVPIFKFVSGTAFNIGGASNMIVNGLLQLSNNTNLVFSAAGNKTFRNGVIADATCTTGCGISTITATGSVLIGDATVASAAQIGGAGLLTVANATGAVIVQANCTANLTNNITHSAGTFTVNGILSCGTNTISGAGAYTQSSTGTIITASTGGLPTTIGVTGTKTFTTGANYTFNAATITPFITGQNSNVGTINCNAGTGNIITYNLSTALGIQSALNINTGTFALSNILTNISLNGGNMTIAANATFNTGGESQIVNGSGTPVVTINGTFITQDVEGFYGTNASFPGIVPVLGNNSVVRYDRGGDQNVTNFNYKFLTISNTGIKSTTGAITSIDSTVTVNTGATLHVNNYSFGNATTKLTLMDYSRFINAGSGTKPDIAGVFTIDPTSTIEFTGSAATIIRQAVNYGKIEISGTNIGLSGTSTTITLQAGTTFTVKNGGTFNVQNTNGFNNTTNSAISTTNNPGIILETGSTINYNSTAAQAIDGRIYDGVTFTNTGLKTAIGNTTINNALTFVSGKYSLNGTTLTLAGAIIGASTTSNFIGSNTSKIIITTGFGSLFFDQTNSADVATINGSNALQNLEIISTGSITLGNKVNLFNKLTLTGGTLETGNFLVLRSTASNTAWVPSVTGAISGSVTVERYIHKTTRGWRGLTAPITFNGIISGTNNTINQNWQSNFGYSGNYGTRVTGGSVVPSGANGLDDVNPSPNMQTWNPVTQTWKKVLSTLDSLQSNSTTSAANIPYFIFVRGDRTVIPSPYAAWVQTTLAAKGLLQTGDQVFTLPGGSQTGAGKSWAIGNPYACPVDMRNVAFTGSTNFVYVWVPEIPNGIANTTTTGKYVTFDRGAMNDWVSPPTGGTTTANQFFQSGQIFFVEPSTAGATVTFTEASKVTTANNNVAVSGKANGITDLFNINLIHVDALGNKSQIDGARAKFGDGFNSDVDSQDALKWSTATVENLSLKRNGKSLVIEARPYIVGVDSLFVNTTNLVVGNNYEFAINPINFDASVSSCVLIDNFLNTQTPISLRTITNVPFNITATTGSNATNRFTIVFNGSGTLPNNNNLTVKAFKKDKTVEVNWDVTAETGMKIYNVEKSVTGNDYKQLGTATAKNGNKANTYSIIDNNPVIGVNYYRVQGVLMNDNSLYSAVVRVEMNSNGIKSVTVYPNPVKGNVIGLQLNNLDQGVYTAKLTTTTGQQVWSKTINHNGNNGSLSVQLNKKVAQGSYQLQLIDAKGNAYSQNVLVVE
jgi:hypothetical protein